MPCKAQPLHGLCLLGFCTAEKPPDHSGLCSFFLLSLAIFAGLASRQEMRVQTLVYCTGRRPLRLLCSALCSRFLVLIPQMKCLSSSLHSLLAAGPKPLVSRMPALVPLSLLPSPKITKGDSQLLLLLVDLDWWNLAEPPSPLPPSVWVWRGLLD